MKPTSILAALVALAVPLLGPLPAGAQAPTAAASAPSLPPDPWPRVVDLTNGQVLVYQPQVNSWTDNRIDFRAALAIKPAGAQQETFGVAFANARTQVDKVARTVVFEDLKVTKLDFPTLPDRGAAYATELTAEFAKSLRSMSLDRLQASLAAAGVKPPTFPVDNTPPRVIVSTTPAILVPIDGTPVLGPVSGYPRAKRVVNTRALILQRDDGTYYLHVYDGWLQSSSIDGPWTQGLIGPVVKNALETIAQQLSAAKTVDLLAGAPNANPKPSLANGVPTIYTPQVPAELVQFNGQPDFVPIVGTQLLWAANTPSDVLIDTTSNLYYVLLAGRWFRSASLSGPWAFVASNALPADFARIPPHSLAGAVLPSVSGTPQAQEAVIANTIPQTATVPLKNGPAFTPSFDGPPQYGQVQGTPLSYVVNSSTPILRMSPSSYYAVEAGVWFTASQLTGPWAVATSVPSVIYTIPTSSPLHYVTYVRIYQATPQVVYVGYTPGYLGVVVEPTGTVVYGTGYVYTPWVGTVWYPAPVTYTVAAIPVYNPYVGFTFGFAMGLATAAWVDPYWGYYGAWYHPAYWGGYPCCATASANVYGHWGNATYSGTRTWYAGGGVAGTTFSGTYSTARGTTGDINAGRQYNAWTGNATRGYDRTFNTASGASGQVARASNYNTYTGQRTTANAASVTGAGGSTYDRAGTTTAGPQGDAHVGGGSTYNAKTGQTNNWATASVGNNHYADINGNVYKNTGDGWEQHSSSGWSSAGGDNSWANRESQARSSGDDRFGSFSSSADRWGGGGSGDRSGGGGGFGSGGFGSADRFSGGGGGFGGDRAGGGGWGGRFGGSGFGGGGSRGGGRR